MKELIFSNADAIYYPVENNQKAMIVVSGSEGGLKYATICAQFLQSHGIAALAVGYFDTEHSPKYLSKIPIETIQEAMIFLQDKGYQKIGIQGISKGAEYALAAAIEYEEISCVILKTPSWFYSEGLKNKKGSSTSCWSYRGKELSYTPYKDKNMHALKQILRHKEFNILESNMNKTINPDSIIEVENIHGPILIFSTKADTVWPSYESGTKLVKRLEAHRFVYAYKHIAFDYMSHIMIENVNPKIKRFFKSERQHPEECALERKMMSDEMIHWIKEVW